MAKRINIKVIQSIEGMPLKKAVTDSVGDPIYEKDKKGKETLKLADSTTLDILDSLIRMFPRERMTMENITEGTRLKTQINEARSTNGNVMVMDESTHDWVKKMLRDESIGPKLFGFNLINIIDAMDDFERVKEKKQCKTEEN